MTDYQNEDHREEAAALAVHRKGPAMHPTADIEQRLDDIIDRLDMLLAQRGGPVCSHCLKPITYREGLWWHYDQRGHWRGCNEGKGAVGAETVATP